MRATTACGPRAATVPAAMVASAFLLAMTWAVTPARAEKLENKVAIFAALDKVTARISRLEVGLGETVTFGSLKVTPRVCYTRPPTEPPRTSAFVEVDEVKLDNSEVRVFTGWMFAESPGLHGVEHPVFDVWLTGCAKPIGGAPALAARPGAREPRQPRLRRRRLRRR